MTSFQRGRMARFSVAVGAALAWLATMGSPTVAAAYDALAVDTANEPRVIDRTVDDQQRERAIPIRVYLPPGDAAHPVVLFSHGLGGSRTGCSYLGEHWSRRGYVAVFLQHPGSDASVWHDLPRAERRGALNRAANADNLMLRVRDVPAVLDQLDAWNQTTGDHLAGRLDLDRVGMSGHSFGAITTQWVSGQRAMRGRFSLADPRIRAAVIFSPSSPRRGSAEEAFGRVDIPWMLMTGTNDLAVIGNIDMDSRLGVYPALPEGRKYELVLHGAEHSAFTERPLPGDREPRNPNHHRAILALSTAFWDAYLRADDDARSWLDGPGPRSVLEPKDRWQRK